MDNAVRQNTSGDKRSNDVPLPKRRLFLAAEASIAYRDAMTRGGGFSCAGDRTNWSSEAFERGDVFDACEASDELEAVRRCMGRLGVGNGSLKERLRLSISGDVVDGQLGSVPS
jgi:hypothetical protein